MGSLTSLDLDDLLAAAPSEWAVAAPDGSEGRQWLERLVDGLMGEGRLSAMGQYLIREELLRSARAAAVAPWPKGRAEPSDRRVVVIGGLPRTGTTLLQLVAADQPATWVPRTWEHQHPDLVGTTDEVAQDAAVADSAVRLATFLRVAKGFEQVHPMAAEAPEEDDVLFALAFESFRHILNHDLPTYRDGWLASDHQRCVDLLVGVLAQVDAGLTPVLKAPGHLHTYRALRATFPDAVFVQVHRPVEVVIASWIDLVRLARGAFSNQVGSYEQLYEEWLGTFSRMVDEALEVRDQHPEGWVGLRYEDLVADPIAAWATIASAAGLEVGPPLDSDVLDGPPHDYDRRVPRDLEARLRDLDERYRHLVLG